MNFLECIEQAARELGYDERAIIKVRARHMEDPVLKQQSEELIPEGHERFFIGSGKRFLNVLNPPNN